MLNNLDDSNILDENQICCQGLEQDGIVSLGDGKHDDYCDSSVIGIHATLAMLPGTATVASTGGEAASRQLTSNIGRHSGASLFRTKGHNFKSKSRYSL